MRGRFIVVEGVDASGKSTLAARLAEAMSPRRRVLLTREPGGTRIGEGIRKILLDARHSGMTPLTELLLYMASRAQLVEQEIRPALRRGIHVVCDRYYYSTAAYQGAAGGLGAGRVIEIAEKVCGFEKPDLVLVLDLPPRIARARKGNRNDRVEGKGLSYQDRVRRGFLDMARRDRRRFRVIDARRTADDVFLQAWKAVGRAL